LPRTIPLFFVKTCCFASGTFLCWLAVSTTPPTAAPAATTTAAPAGETTAAPAAAGNFKVGITIQSLENSYWAGVFGEVETLLKAKGWEYTILACNDNSATQIQQIENFITNEVDLIMVHPSDPNAIEDYLQECPRCWHQSHGLGRQDDQQRPQLGP